MTSLFSYSRLRPAPQCAPQCAPHCESSASSSCRRASNSEPQTPISESHRPAELRIRIPNIAGPARTLPTKLPVPHTECFPHHSRKSRLALSYLILSYPILPYLATPSAGLKSTADRQSASSPPGCSHPHGLHRRCRSDSHRLRGAASASEQAARTPIPIPAPCRTYSPETDPLSDTASRRSELPPRPVVPKPGNPSDTRSGMRPIRRKRHENPLPGAPPPGSTLSVPLHTCHFLAVPHSGCRGLCTGTSRSGPAASGCRIRTDSTVRDRSSDRHRPRRVRSRTRRPLLLRTVRKHRS